MAKFTIAIPAYKVQFLQECIQSVLSQTYRDFELVILNDCSPYDIDGILQKYSDDRIRYFKNDKNVGAYDVVANWNKLLELANGDYIICMGDDDKLLPNCLQEYDALIKKYPELDVFHAWTEVIDEHSNPYSMQEPRPEYEGLFSLIWNRWYGRHQFIGDFCFNRKTLLNVGGFFNLPYAWGSDDLTSFIMCGSKGIANSQVPMFQYRSNRQSITSSGDISGKMDALMGEKQKILELMKIQPTDNIESIFKGMIDSEIEHHFRLKAQDAIISDITSSGMSTWFRWLFKRKEFNLSFSNMIWIGVLSMKNKFVK